MSEKKKERNIARNKICDIYIEEFENARRIRNEQFEKTTDLYRSTVAASRKKCEDAHAKLGLVISFVLSGPEDDRDSDYD